MASRKVVATFTGPRGVYHVEEQNNGVSDRVITGRSKTYYVEGKAFLDRGKAEAAARKKSGS